ncbi:TonB-dependent receptor [Acidicapsa acidisoli]|uniref:TonB-dependent receptor n=1 Tax=Acidicapsa acidisoli TaxID=1615681 RepID=UPI0021DF4D6D|nr:carboxypeptidase-like regulatory domain-containing protein [Acidicapsa acidisoli]
MRLARFRFLIVPVFFLFACVAAMAQQNSEIVGTVTDQTGAAVPGATLTLTQTETGFVYNTVSNSTGGYAFNGLNVGTYNLKASAKGFEGFTATGLALNVSQTLAQEIKLTIGAETVNVSVTADALQVQAESNTVSNLISGEQVTEIATENRNFTALAALGLGVSSLLPDNNTPTSVASSASISVNGLRESHNIWLIDGGEADDRGGAGGMDVMPSPDAIAQFEVLASNYPPDYGIASGATMSLSLKSGTQKFHGEAYDFLRNDDLDANYFFNKYNRSCTPTCSASYSPVAKLRQNVFGGNVGGPLFIPHLYNTNKQKTFFFFNQEWRRIIQGSAPNVQPTIPDADRPVAGQDLTYFAPAYAPNQVLQVPSTTQVSDPAFAAKVAAAGLVQGAPFGTNSSGHQFIPASMLSPNAVLYLQSPLIPKVTNTSNDNSVSSIVNPINVWESIVRIDHKVNDKWQILGHYIHDSVSQGYPDADLNWNWESYNTISSTLSNPSNSAAIKMSGEISPSLLVEASMNYDGNIINITNSADALTPSGWTQANFFTNSGSNQFPGLNGLSGNGIGVGEETGYGGWHNAAEDYDPKVDISYTRGKHAFKFGFGYNRYTKNQQQQADSAGDYSFSQNLTGNGNGGTSGDPFMSLAIGLSGGFSQPQSDAIRHYVNQTTSVYGNDNWKVSPRFSLQIGFRYDALPHAWERNNALANFVPSQYIQIAPMWNADNSINSASVGVSQPTGFPGSYYLNGMVFPGNPGVPHGLVNNDYDTFQPRVGFSYDLTGTGKTVLRGGFGTFYERMQGNDIYGLANSNLPFEYTPSVNNVYYDNPHCSWSSTASTANPSNCLSVSNLPILPASLTTLDTTYKAPATAQFSLGIQHELQPSLIWVLQYVGNLAWHQNVDVNLNNFPINTPNIIRQTAAGFNGLTFKNPGLANAYRTYAGYGGISQEENTTNGTYNGFQTGLRAQNKHGLSGEVDYTYSHVIDLTDTDLQGVSNPWNLKYDKGGGEYDRRHILSANYIYKLPVFNQSQGLLHTVLGGWELAGTIIAQSGSPISNNNSQAGFSGVDDPIGLDGGYTNRANLVSKIHYSKKVADWFDTTSSDFGDCPVTPANPGGTAPLCAPVPGWLGGPNLGFGNARRDTFIGPDRVNFTTSLYKSFAVTERAHFDLRVETFNTFNHTEFNNSIGVTVGGGNYGQETGTYDPRVMEVAGKFVF